MIQDIGAASAIKDMKCDSQSGENDGVSVLEVREDMLRGIHGNVSIIAIMF